MVILPSAKVEEGTVGGHPHHVGADVLVYQVAGSVNVGAAVLVPHHVGADVLVCSNAKNPPLTSKGQWGIFYSNTENVIIRNIMEIIG